MFETQITDRDQRLRNLLILLQLLDQMHETRLKDLEYCVVLIQVTFEKGAIQRLFYVYISSLHRLNNLIHLMQKGRILLNCVISSFILLVLNMKWTLRAKKCVVPTYGLILHPSIDLLSPVDLLAELLQIESRALEFTLLEALWREILVKLFHDHPDYSINRFFTILNLWLKHQRN